MGSPAVPPVGRHGAPGTLAATDLQHDDRLAQGSGAVERADEAIGLPVGLDERPDRLGPRVLDEIFEIVGGGEHGFVAGRDDVAEAETPRVVQQADAERAALRDDADIAGQSARVAQLLQIGRAGVVRVEHAHAVGTAQRDIRLPADPLDLALQSAPLSALLGKAAIIDYRALDPALRRRDEGPKNPPVAKAEHRDIRRLGQFGHARVAGMTEDGRVARIDRVNPAGEPDPLKRGNDSTADRRLLRRADHGDRPGLKQRFEPH